MKRIPKCQVPYIPRRQGNPTKESERERESERKTHPHTQKEKVREGSRGTGGKKEKKGETTPY